MSDMKTWVTTETGKVYHSFGVVHAECRKSIKPGTGRPMISESRVDEILAKPWGVSTQGYRKCEKCAQLEADFRSRAEASMQPSTGEGDHLPPAVETNTPQTPSKEENMNVTPEVIQALALIRSQPGSTSEEALANVLGAIDILDNAGVFAAIDEATGYDVDPEPQRTSKCTCPPYLRWPVPSHGSPNRLLRGPGHGYGQPLHLPAELRGQRPPQRRLPRGPG